MKVEDVMADLAEIEDPARFADLWHKLGEIVKAVIDIRFARVERASEARNETTE